MCGEGGLRPESWEHWPSGDIREEAEAKARMKVPRGSEGSPERTLEASGAKDFKKEVVNRINVAKQSGLQRCQCLTTEIVGDSGGGRS